MNYEYIPHCLLLTSAMVAAGCNSAPNDRTQVQGVARVNDSEITVHQLNDEIARQEYMTDRALADAPDVLLDRLIDQELLVQQALKLSLERTPEVTLSIGRERRQILAQAYLERVMATVSEPTDGEIAAHYNANPAFYSERKEFGFLQLSIDFPNTDNGMAAAINEQLEAAAALEDFVAWLNSAGIEYVLVHRIATAEAMEPPILEALSKLQGGEFGRIRANDGLVLLQLRSTRDKAISEQDAYPVIRRLLTDQRRIEAATTELESLRQRADIEILLDPGINLDPAA